MGGFEVVPIHTYITNPSGHVVRFTNLALIRYAFCGAFSMNGKPKAGIVFKMADVVAGVVDVGQSFTRRVCSESSALLNAISLELDTQRRGETRMNCSQGVAAFKHAWLLQSFAVT